MHLFYDKIIEQLEDNMKNNLFNKYVQYIQYFEKMTCYEKNIIQQLNPNIIDENRILHYKTDLLF